jgi:hypothetical protein
MYEYRIKKVVKVVDGDTIDVEIDLGFNISYAQRVRLAGIDTPESRTKDAKEKVLGLEVFPIAPRNTGASWAGYIWMEPPSQSTSNSLTRVTLGVTWARPKSKTLMPYLQSARATSKQSVSKLV